MYSYKINNSSTVYVNWNYYAEVRKICAAKKTKEIRKISTVKSTGHTCGMWDPMAPGTKVESRQYGIGTVVSTTQDGKMSVSFDARIVRFLYPEVIKQGHLRRV